MTLVPQEQVQPRNVEQVVNVPVEMRGHQSISHRSRVGSGTLGRPGDTRRRRGNRRLSFAVNTVGAKRFHCPGVLFQPRSKIHDTSFQSVMKFDTAFVAAAYASHSSDILDVPDELLDNPLSPRLRLTKGATLSQVLLEILPCSSSLSNLEKLI